MSGELGSGPLLDQTLDFDVGSDGDLRITEGEEELGKDLAFQLLFVLGEKEGQPLTPNTRSEVKSLTVSVLLSDDRVRSVDESGMIVREVGRGELEVDVSLLSTDGPQEFVFTV